MRGFVLALVVAGRPLGAQMLSHANTTQGWFSGLGQYLTLSVSMGAAPMQVHGATSATLTLPDGGAPQTWAIQFKPAPTRAMAASVFGQLQHRASGIGVDLEWMGGHDWSAFRYGVSLERARQIRTSPLSVTGSVAYSRMDAQTTIARTVVGGDGMLTSSNGQRYRSDSLYTTLGGSFATDAAVGLRWAHEGGFAFVQSGYRFTNDVTSWGMDPRVVRHERELSQATWSDARPRVHLGGAIARIGFGIYLGRDN